MMNKDFKKLEEEHARQTKRIQDDSEAKFTADMEAWTAERLRKKEIPGLPGDN